MPPPAAPVQEDGSTVTLPPPDREVLSQPETMPVAESPATSAPTTEQPATTPEDTSDDTLPATGGPERARLDHAAPEGHARAAARRGAGSRRGAHSARSRDAAPVALASFEQFLEIDMRVGRVVSVDEFPEARKPAWKLRIDFGPEIGRSAPRRRSAITRARTSRAGWWWPS